MSMPPVMATFFMKLICCIIFCAASTAQKLWKTSAARIVKPASASAAQRAFQPIARRIPPPSSVRIVSGNSTPTIGRPLAAIAPAVPSYPVILPNPEVMKMTARRMRPTSAAVFAKLGFMIELRVVVSVEVEKQHFGTATLSDAHGVIVAPQLHGVARREFFSVHRDLAARDVQIDPPRGPGMEFDRLVPVDERRVHVGILVDADRAVARVARRDEA